VRACVRARRDFLLQLPHNTAAFASLAGLGLHPAFKDVQSRLPLANRALAQRLAATLSQLAHWCPVFGEVAGGRSGRCRGVG
jgi:hypothetical protein